MIMDFILFLLTVHGKKIAKSGYSAHSSMRDSNNISPEGKVKGALSAVISSKSHGTAQSGRFHCSIQAKPLLNFAGRGDFAQRRMHRVSFRITRASKLLFHRCFVSSSFVGSQQEETIS